MNMIDGFMGELKHEAEMTRKVLERLPAEKFGWKPHEKSFSLGKLASHVAEIPGWMSGIIQQDVFDVSKDYVPFEAKRSADLLQKLEEGVKSALAAMPGTSNERLMANWALKSGDQVMFEMPRVAVLRNFVLNHIVHHRAQLTVYMRLLNISVPAIYGPSADEKG